MKATDLQPHQLSKGRMMMSSSSSNQDQIFKIPSLKTLPRRGELLQVPIMGPACPLLKMNIPVVDQQQRQPTNKPTLLFDTYHRLYWDNEQEEHRENP
uniref:Uncharacterized protein n=1 Tax=Romanomermis culicivorax TaxID=13658 RepID=A0A915IM14_ROMCU